MNCHQAREFLPLLDAGSLDTQVTQQVSEHLQACPVCQVSLEKTRKLRAMLALKRYEQPDELFLRTFVADFHRRLDAAPAVSEGWWARLRTTFELDDRAVMALRASVALVAVLLVLVGVHFYGAMRNGTAERQVAVRRSQLPPAGLSTSPWSDVVVKSDQNTVYVLDRVAYTASTHEPAILTF